MKLSELKTGESGIIVKVLGHGGFRKRIIEMGFIKGQKVEVLLNAPLQDPVKYKLMGYEVSLRHQEADNIEVVSTDTPIEETHFSISNDSNIHEDDYIQHEAMKERRTINVALVGNPNCGKTSLFNYASVLMDMWAITLALLLMRLRHMPHSLAMSSTLQTCLAPTPCLAILPKNFT